MSVAKKGGVMTGITWDRGTVDHELRRLDRNRRIQASCWICATLASATAIVGILVLVGT